MERPTKLSLFIEHWIAGWIDIVVGVVNVLTFTLYRPWWDFEWIAWNIKRRRKCDK